VSAFPGALAAHVQAYHDTAQHNDRANRELTAATAAGPLLNPHLQHIGQHTLGRAGHSSVFQRIS